MGHHILVGVYDPTMRALLAEVLADEGHAVTVPQDFWGGLAVLRSALHPLIVLYTGDGSLGLLKDEHLAAIEANTAALRRHEYIQFTWRDGPWPAHLQRLVDQVHIQAIPGIVPMEVLLEAVDRAATHLAEQAGA